MKKMLARQNCRLRESKKRLKFQMMGSNYWTILFLDWWWIFVFPIRFNCLFSIHLQLFIYAFYLTLFCHLMILILRFYIFVEFLFHSYCDFMYILIIHLVWMFWLFNCRCSSYSDNDTDNAENWIFIKKRFKGAFCWCRYRWRTVEIDWSSLFCFIFLIFKAFFRKTAYRFLFLS